MRRLIAVEKTLKIPLEDRSQCAAELREAKVVEIIAIRHHDGLVLDTLGRPINEKENSPQVGIRAYTTISKSATSTKGPEPVSLLSCFNGFFTSRDQRVTIQAPVLKKKTGQKSKWQGRNGQIIDVETRALEFYEDQGFRG